MIDKEELLSCIRCFSLYGKESDIIDLYNKIFIGEFDVPETCDESKTSHTLKSIDMRFESLEERIEKLKEEITNLKKDLNSSVEIINTNFGNIFKHLAPPKLEIPGFENG